MNLHSKLKIGAVLVLAASLAGIGCKSKTADQSGQDQGSQMSNDGSGSNGSSNGSSGSRNEGGREHNGGGSKTPHQPPPPQVVNLPAGTTIRVRLDSDLGSKLSQPGDTFTATVADDVMSNGQVIIPQGSRADGTVTDAKPLGHFKGGALLAVQLDKVHTQWGSYPVSTGTIDKVEAGKGRRSVEFIGGGAGLGALIGGLTGGGKGALIGGLAGAGAGTAGSAFTGNKQIVLPAETMLTFHLNNAIQITE